MATKINLKMEYDLKVLKNPKGMGWVIQDAVTCCLLTRKPKGGLCFSPFVRYAPASKGYDGHCNNGSLWPDKATAQSFLDQILGATQAVEEAAEMATQTLAWAVGMGGTAHRSFKDFLIRRTGPSDGWTDDEWLSEGRYQDPLTKMPVILMYQSGPSIEALAKAIREKYATENIWVDNRPEVPAIFQVGRVMDLPKTALPKVTYAPLPEQPDLVSEFVPGNYAVFDAKTQLKPTLVKITAVEFRAPVIAGRGLEVYYTFYFDGERKACHHSNLFTSVESWKTQRDGETRATYDRLKKELDSTIADDATLSPVVNTSPDIKFTVEKAARHVGQEKSRPFIAFMVRPYRNKWVFTDETVQGLIDRIRVQYPAAEIEVKV